ncbi:MAG: hypothetical protein SFU91_14925 [Chloroherpetonaceae bacterium]|nr:hypothetical protein [Chloroherpetonaceae bacterium]
MKNNIKLFLVISICIYTGFIQTDKEQLALEVSKVDAENIEKLKKYIWKMHSVVSGEGGNKTTLVSEFKFDQKGELSITVVDGKTNIDRKAGIRGKVQQNAMQSKLEYVSNAMKYSLAYTYMTKGQLLDFFEKADVYESNGIIKVFGKNVIVNGDELTIFIDAKTKFFIRKSFSTKMGSDPIKWEVLYEIFQSSGINHISKSKLELPTERITIEGENKDYTVRVD